MFRIADCMKTFINKILVIAILGMGLVACSKEEVKPFTAPGGSSSITNDFNTKSLTGDGVTTDPSAEQQNGTTTEDDGSGVTSGSGEEGSNITDGGTSSDYDSKGTKRKPARN